MTHSFCSQIGLLPLLPMDSPNLPGVLREKPPFLIILPEIVRYVPFQEMRPYWKHFCHRQMRVLRGFPR